MNKKERVQSIIGIISCIICGCILLGYCEIVKEKTGVFSLSPVSNTNSLIQIIDSGAYKNIDNEEFEKTIDGSYESSWKAKDAVIQKYDNEQIKQLIKSSKRTKEYAIYLVKKTVKNGFRNIGVNYAEMKGAEHFYRIVGLITLPIPFGILYIMMFICIIYLIKSLIKEKKINWILAFCVSLISANIFTLLVGAPYEEARLFVSSIPITLILIAYIIDRKGVCIKDIFYKIFIKQTKDTKLQFFRYLFVGGFAAIVNIGSLYIFTEFLHLYYLISNILGFLLGLTTNYLLSKWLIFVDSELNKVIEFIIYAIIGVIGLGIDTFFVWLITNLGIYYIISKVISTCLVFIWNFFGRKAIYVIMDKRREK